MTASFALSSSNTSKESDGTHQTKTETFWTDAEIGIARDIARFRRLSVTYHTYYTK
jgi:ribonucleotide reductase beta subunit family protein with ferritin-like domain